MNRRLVWGVLLVSLVAPWAQGMRLTDARQDEPVKEVIQIYLDGMAKADHKLLNKAFYPEARINRVGPDGTLYNWAFTEWVNFVRLHPDYPTPLSFSKIEKLEVVGEEKSEALVQLRMTYRGVEYVELITLLKIKGDWKIINKSFDGKFDAGDKK